MNIHAEKFVIPCGVWPKDPHFVSFPHIQMVIDDNTDPVVQKKLGVWAQAGVEAGLEGGALAALTRFKNWTKEEVLLLASEARADGRKRDIHSMFNL